MARIYDNIDIKFEEGINQIISSPGVKRVDFCVGYFNLRGWNLVVDQVDRLEGDFVLEGRSNEFRTCRLLVGMHQPPDEIIRQLYSKEQSMIDSEQVQKLKRRIAKDFRHQLLLGVPTQRDELTLRRLATQLRERRVVVRLSAKPIHAKLYVAYAPDDYRCPKMAVLGSSNLTYSGLNYQGELNAEFAEHGQAEQLSNWFDDRWNDRYSIDITDELVTAIEESWAADKTIPPYYIYLKIAYHLSEEARKGLKEFSLTPEFRHDLFEFQQNAVKIVARHLNNERRKGAMIGDVVGLGKTITACAVAKMYELYDGSSTLVVCPANLQEMWMKYIKKYDLKAEVMSMAKTIDVENSRFYKLIIVDESHNLRNGGKRYTNIKRLIEHQSSRVLLLTATPYNKDYSDLATQLRLFLSNDQDLGVRPERYIDELGGERGFLQTHPDIHIRTIGAFEKSENVEDWNELMKLFLVRRTRSFIKNNFAKSDAQKGGRKYLEFPDGRRSYFPDRIPRKKTFETQPGDQYSRLYSEEMLEKMESLALPRYGLSHYINEKAAMEAPSHIQQIIDNLSRAGARMMGFCKSTFFKRIDSSGFSFLLTLYRHILRNCVYLYAIDNKLPLPIGDNNVLPEDYCEDGNSDNVGVFGDDAQVDPAVDATLNIPTDMAVYMAKAKEYYEMIYAKSGGNISWLDPKYFKRTLKQQLKKDCDTVIEMIKLCGKWEQKNDQKLNVLEKLLLVDHPTDKVVVFTQYSDTARYISNQLRKRGVKNVDCATGGSENPTAIAERFSPESNDKSIPMTEQTRVLISTDVLSEGHNLQDAHVIVNYDLPWAIIRLIQRAGRVDRIGQKADEIFCYSFFPAEGVERIINLRGRLNDRINANANIVGSDEIFFEGNEQNLRDMFNEKAGVLDDADDADVDLASQAFQIWSNAIKAHKELKQIIPNMQNMVYSTQATAILGQEGVITYTRSASGFDTLTWLNHAGNIITQSQQKILQAVACDYQTPAELPLEDHHELVGKASEIVKKQAVTTSAGALGNHRSVRARLYHFLLNYYERPTDIFFTNELKEEINQTIDEIAKFTLKDAAKTTIGRMLQNTNKSATDDLVDYVLDLRRSGALCNVVDEDEDMCDNEIICSMGLKHIAE